MANRPDNKPAGNERVAFTRPAAERIARAVRQVESGKRDQGPLSFGYRPTFAPASAKGIRFCSWTADWQHNTSQKVTFDPATNGTAIVTNAVLGFGPGKGWAARKGTAGWHLIGADLTLQPGYAADEIQLFGHDDNGIANWYSITTCATATA